MASGNFTERVYAPEKQLRDQAWAKAYEKGKSIRQIAAESHYSYGCVHKGLARQEVEFRPRGGAHGKKSSE